MDLIIPEFLGPNRGARSRAGGRRSPVDEEDELGELRGSVLGVGDLASNPQNLVTM
jgi:hypothetical protein